MRKLALLSVFLVAVIVVGVKIFANTDYFYMWQSSKEHYGRAYNDKRKQLGIPLIPSGWYTKDTSIVPEDVMANRFIKNPWLKQIWREARSDIEGGYYKEKELRRNSQGGIVSESDRYVKKVNDSIQWLLEINYSYFSESDDKDNRWDCFLLMEDEGGLYENRVLKLSLAQADSVLLKWGLSRIPSD